MWCGMMIDVVSYLYRIYGGSVTIMPACAGLMAGSLPAATVEYVPTVFCWLGCQFGVHCIMSIGVLCALYMCLFFCDLDHS
jgi:hypothetical protein